MEHLHHQRRSLVLLLIVVASTFGVACGSHESTGDGRGLPEPERNVGGDPIGGADLGGANDPGTGIVPEKPPVLCTSDAECVGGICTGDSTRVGVCLRVCAAPPDFAFPGISVMRCLGDEECIAIPVRSSSAADIGVCLRRCTSTTDCPDFGLSDLRDRCESIQPGASSFCVAEQVGPSD